MCRKSRFVLVLFSFCSHTFGYTIFYPLKNSRPALLVFPYFSNISKKFLIKCTQFFVVFFGVLSLFWCPPFGLGVFSRPFSLFWCIRSPWGRLGVSRCPSVVFSRGIKKAPFFGGLGVAWRFSIQ